MKTVTKVKPFPKWVMGIYWIFRNTCRELHGTAKGLCDGCSIRAIREGAGVERDLWKRRIRRAK